MSHYRLQTKCHGSNAVAVACSWDAPRRERLGLKVDSLFTSSGRSKVEYSVRQDALAGGQIPPGGCLRRA
ncbi:hypothetical protein BO70DRAFT_136634 [Aspergillus heteromorphus CBS 117.55]|uniref:Uncharacterized protein n=1 Tax=Aspergillus heteromorphus CBS 117.55 TaxID=1448321 RepID=A0A317WUV2_9EURO|nr:uncharacterized protein BO70DRAFT_136634 [Aspergillus heteromorphus CBS 117.55]PWY90204.1 hypothetical protein BO70DRAFT_136634 [Aspergillus heteromorphus CBS 117.55]